MRRSSRESTSVSAHCCCWKSPPRLTVRSQKQRETFALTAQYIHAVCTAHPHVHTYTHYAQMRCLASRTSPDTTGKGGVRSTCSSQRAARKLWRESSNPRSRALPWVDDRTNEREERGMADEPRGGRAFWERRERFRNLAAPGRDPAGCVAAPLL